MEDIILKKLLLYAKEASLKNKNCKYSNYSVGAALLTENDEIYCGFNIENNGLQSICAERCAFCNALVHGEKKFKAIFVVGKNVSSDTFIKTTPCGYCRQFMCEYTHPDFLIYTYDENDKKIYKYKMKDLLPESFNY